MLESILIILIISAFSSCVDGVSGQAESRKYIEKPESTRKTAHLNRELPNTAEKTKYTKKSLQRKQER